MIQKKIKYRSNHLLIANTDHDLEHWTVSKRDGSYYSVNMTYTKIKQLFPPTSKVHFFNPKTKKQLL